MLVRDFECRSFERAHQLIAGKPLKMVCNSTCLIRCPNSDIQVRLHGHVIVEFTRHGITRLWSRGFRTPTTKSRINKCLHPHLRLIQKKGKWYIWNPSNKEQVSFVEGIYLRSYTLETRTPMPGTYV